jgi:hypothetical protein
MRCSGESKTPPATEPFTHHEDFRKFLRALEIDRISLVGLSNYAVAVDFTIAYPELVYPGEPAQRAALRRRKTLSQPSEQLTSCGARSPRGMVSITLCETSGLTP